jgi:hypothetical protein
MKTCSKCNQTKSFGDFYKDKGRKTGLSPYCKDCYKQKSADYYLKNVEKIKITHKNYEEKTNFQEKWRKENKNYFVEWKKNNPEYFVEWKKNNPDYHKKYWIERKKKLELSPI